jgi:hypothetical protein
MAAPAPSPPDVSSPPSPLPELAQGLVATTTAAARSFSSVATLSPKMSVPSPSLSPPAPVFISHGRPKQERRRDHNPLLVSPGSPLSTKNLGPSFRDVLLAKGAPGPSASVAAGTVVTALAVPPAPRSLTTVASHEATPTLSTEQGW